MKLAVTIFLIMPILGFAGDFSHKANFLHDIDYKKYIRHDANEEIKDAIIKETKDEDLEDLKKLLERLRGRGMDDLEELRELLGGYLRRVGLRELDDLVELNDFMGKWLRGRTGHMMLQNMMLQTQKDLQEWEEELEEGLEGELEGGLEGELEGLEEWEKKELREWEELEEVDIKLF